MKMICEIRTFGETACLTLKGEIYENEAEILKQHFNNLPGCRYREIVLDLGELDYIGSSGIGKFLLLYKKMAGCHGTMRLTRTPAHICGLLHAMRLNDLFEITTH